MHSNGRGDRIFRETHWPLNNLGPIKHRGNNFRTRIHLFKHSCTYYVFGTMPGVGYGEFLFHEVYSVFGRGI